MFRFSSQSTHATKYTSFFLYLFEISDEIKTSSINEILEKFIKHPYFRDQSDWGKEKTEKFFFHAAFVIENLSVKDFKKIDGKDIEKTVLSCLDEELWQQADSTVRNDYRNTFLKSKWFTDELNIGNDQAFYMNLDWYIETEKVIDPYWIWDYALTFILINQTKTRLIMLDYGMD